MKRFPKLLPVVLLFAVALVSGGDRDDTAAFDKAVDKLSAEGYPQGLVRYFCSLGTNADLGFRWAGTTAERAVGERVAAEMRAMGLANVRLEPVPVDVFEFEKAGVAVGDRAMIASTIAGVRPTPEAGITAPVVYVKGGTAAEFDAAGDVAGKLVLVDMRMSSWWFFWPAFEAAHRGATGIIGTYSPEDTKYFSVDDQALGSFDGQYDWAAPPWVYIARRDGDWLKARLASGPVTATLLLEEKVTLERDGGVAYNVIGELPGERGDGQMVLMAAHQDAHFRAGVDDTGALANMLAVAKAMRASGHRPKSTIVFLATAAEEFGGTNSYYDWLVGSWWAVTRAHPDWAGRVRGMITLESMAVKGAPLGLRSNPELQPWLKALVGRHPELVPNGFELLKPVNSWNDQWPFSASGIPSVKFETFTDAYDTLYHSSRETAELEDWDYLAKLAKFVFRITGELDGGLLPYSLPARANDLAAAVNAGELAAAGADPAAVSRLVAGAAAFEAAAGAFDAAAKAIPAAEIEPANAALLSVEKDINSGFTALSPADDDVTIYPHQALLREALGLRKALAALKGTRPDRAAALAALAGTGMTRFGVRFSYPVYQKQLARVAPGFPRLGFGELAQLSEPLDVMPQYRRIESGDVAGAVPELETALRARLALLDKRLEEMAGVLDRVTARIRDLSGGRS